MIRALRPLYHIVSYHWTQQHLTKNAVFQNKFAGERCFILCTGASLKNLDLLKLSEKGHILGCNLLYKHPQFPRLKLTAFFELDPARGLRNHPVPELQANTYFKTLDEKFRKKNVPMFFTAENIRYFRRNGLFSDNDLYFLKPYRRLENARKLSNDIAGKFTFSDGVVYGMIATAIYMGFKEIYLAGCDYTFSPMQFGHFYENWTKTEFRPTDERHFKIREFARAHGVTIRNIVPQGFTSPVYEAIDLPKLNELPVLQAGL